MNDTVAITFTEDKDRMARRAKAMKQLDKLRDAAVKALEALHKGYSAEMDAIKEDGAEAPDLIPFYGAIRDAEEKLEVPGDKLHGIHDHLKYGVIPETWERDDLGAMSTSNGDRIHVTIDTMASILKDNRPAAFKWLRANKHGDLIQETVNAQTLSAFARTWMEEKGKDFPKNAFIKVETRPKANFTRGKKEGSKK